METEEIRVRIATEADAAALQAIYAPYVTDTAITFEYEVPTVEQFAARIRKVLQKYPFLVAETNGEIVGYTYAGVFHDRAAYDWAVETSVYVRRDCRRGGIGRALYTALEQALGTQGILNLNACISDAGGEDPYVTDDSVRFHEKMGYHFAGHFSQCGYKFRRWYHVTWMEKNIGEHTENQPPVQPFRAVREQLEARFGIR